MWGPGYYHIISTIIVFINSDTKNAITDFIARIWGCKIFVITVEDGEMVTVFHIDYTNLETSANGDTETVALASISDIQKKDHSKAEYETAKL
jgi:hypothetical protein